MPRRTNAFQRLVTLLTATLGDKATVTESAMLIDRVTGDEREVDVLVSAAAATYQLNIAIEVVAWKRPADTPWVEKMRAKHANLSTDKLILVSEGGFAAPAIKKAAFYNIETLSIEEACAADWPSIANLEETGIFEVMTMNFETSASCKYDSGATEVLPVPLSGTISSEGEAITVDSLVRSVLDRADVRDVIRDNVAGGEPHEFWLEYSKPHGLWRFEIDGRRGLVETLRIKLKVVNSATPVRLVAGKFLSVPFVGGHSTTSRAPLQFVLARKPDGSSSGYLVDGAGVRTLSAPRPRE